MTRQPAFSKSNGGKGQVTDNLSVFKPGDWVSVTRCWPDDHHRTPDYIKGKVGRIESLRGWFRNPESLAYGGSGLPKVALYQVGFEQTEVWKRYQGSAGDKIYIDIYEHWLKRSQGGRRT